MLTKTLRSGPDRFPCSAQCWTSEPEHLPHACSLILPLLILSIILVGHFLTIRKSGNIISSMKDRSWLWVTRDREINEGRRELMDFYNSHVSKHWRQYEISKYNRVREALRQRIVVREDNSMMWVHALVHYIKVEIEELREVMRRQSIASVYVKPSRLKF